MICEICIGKSGTGKGWTLNELSQPVPCPLCRGRGELSWYALAKRLKEQPSTIARVRQGRSKPKTSWRVFEKVCALLWPKGQQVMFR